MTMLAFGLSELGLPRWQSLTRVGRRRIGMFRPPRIGMFRGSRLGAPHAGSRWLAWRVPHPLWGVSVGSAPQFGMFCGPPFTLAVVDACDGGANGRVTSGDRGGSLQRPLVKYGLAHRTPQSGTRVRVGGHGHPARLPNTRWSRTRVLGWGVVRGPTTRTLHRTLGSISLGNCPAGELVHRRRVRRS